MSTKCSIGYADDHHLYEECWDTSNVYLQLDKSFEVEVSTFDGRPSVTVQIDVTLWRRIVQEWLDSPWGQDDSKDHRKVEIDFTALERMISKGRKDL